MRIKQIELSITKNIGNYESAKYGIIADLDYDETPNWVALKSKIEEAHNEIFNKKTAPTPAAPTPAPTTAAKKKAMTKKQEDAVVEKLKKDNTSVTIEMIERYYSITDEQKKIFSNLINNI